MVAGVAHEVNNPLNNMLVAARETARRLERAGGFDPKLAEYLAIVERNGERIGALVRQLREFARPGEFRQVPLGLDAVVRDAAAFFETRFRNRAVDFVLDLAPDLPMVSGDATRLQQVFVNLLVNAEDAMEGQTEPKKVTIATRLAAPDKVQATVDDTGCGIPEEILEAIFDPFFTTKPPTQGTGLGLSISKSIIDMHGGRLWAEANPAGRGARFVVELGARDAGEGKGP
jgi:signal transduction histidine kinase